MRLIDTQTHLLLEPWKAAGKEYAILSHTWGDQEVIFQEWEQLFPSGAIKGQCPHVRHDGIDKKAGYHKVVQACEQARRNGIRYLWCDTMCINKESSAELSEAINSMFKWYRDAQVCYVYLTDVTFPSKKTRHGLAPARSNFPGWFPHAMERKQDDDIREMKSRFMASRWWTRGWTLQELLAPKNVAFFTLDWVLLGHKSGIAPWISAWTRIHREALEDCTTIDNFSIAQRMSWAADRTTTVVEDMAYCLLGLFNINMPMLYGQGGGAFQKLQHEIIKASDDQSIFAWAPESEGAAWTGALAKSPCCFKSCGSIFREPGSLQQPYSLTNVGFKMRVPMIKSVFETQYYIGLGCFLELNENSPGATQGGKNRRRFQVWIPVRKRGDGGLYERIHMPTSHVYFQSSYPSSGRILDKPDIYLLEFPSMKALRRTPELANLNGVSLTGIVLSVGFGNMSMVSQAYKDTWHPRSFRVIPVGHRRPFHLSHEVIASGNYCIILSVAWDGHGRPSMHKQTTLFDIDAQNLPKLLDQLAQTQRSGQGLSDVHLIHEHIRAVNHKAVDSGQNAEAPMVIVEDETLYDRHQSAYVMVDIVFKDKHIPDSDRKQISYDIAFA